MESYGKRDVSVSLIRTAALFMVIFCHIFEYMAPATGRFAQVFTCVGNYCANGVQIFFLISGFLYAGRAAQFETGAGRFGFILRNYKKILSDYWIYCFGLLAPEELSAVTALGVLLTSHTLWGVHHLWFVSYILLCYFITPWLYDLKGALRKWEGQWRYVAAILLVCFLTVCLGFFFDSYFVPEWICAYLIGFFMPEMMEAAARKHMGKALVSLVAVVCIVTNVFRFFARYMYAERFSGGLTGMLTDRVCNWSQVFFAVVVFLLLKGRVKPGTGMGKLLRFFDRYSFSLYITHMIYVKGPLSTVFLTPSLVVNIGITLAVIFISGVAFHHICEGLKRLGRRMRKRRITA